MPRTITLSFPGDPMPAPRPRFGLGVTYMAVKYTSYKEVLGWAFKEKMGRKKPMKGALLMTLDFYRRTRHRVDIDNLEKTVLDAGNGVAWLDDSQIIDLHSRKFLGCADPRTEVRLEEVEGE